MSLKRQRLQGMQPLVVGSYILINGAQVLVEKAHDWKAPTLEAAMVMATARVAAAAALM